MKSFVYTRGHFYILKRLCNITLSNVKSFATFLVCTFAKSC